MDKKELSNIPVLEDGSVFIYILRNSVNSIKVGKTTNLPKRIQSLSGSNSAGHTIDEIWVSPPTWLHNIEKIAHEHFSHARMSGEWFDGTKVTFDSVVEYVDGLFKSDDYARCNALRERVIKEKRDK